MKKTKAIIILSLIMPFLCSCWEDKSFHVEEADISIDIERIEIGKYRVYIYQEEEDRGKDYIDIDYDMSDMPTIQLSIPKNENNKIFVIDTRHDVKHINSYEFNFVHICPEWVKNGEHLSLTKMDQLDKTFAQIDSVRDSIPSITIQLNSRLNDLYVWKNGKYEYRKMVKPLNIGK
ncbi:MAG: hypothetical protein K2L17_09465 [Muribaculaceae bacterium]|nr:hypothetical protein [Muribaculaceae bacterium]